MSTECDSGTQELAEQTSGQHSAEHPASRVESPLDRGAARRVVFWAASLLVVGARRAAFWSGCFLVVCTVAGLAYTSYLLHAQHQQALASTQALDAARAYAVTLTTTDQRAIDQNIRDVLDGATADFKDTYGRAASQLRKMLIDNKVTTNGNVTDAAVVSAHGEDVDVLLAVKQDVSSQAEPKPRTDHLSVTMTMRHVDGRWLAARVGLAGGEMPS